MRGDWMDRARRFEDIDRAALRDALLELRVCPNQACRRYLKPVALLDEVWGCENCRETWHLPKP